MKRKLSLLTFCFSLLTPPAAFGLTFNCQSNSTKVQIIASVLALQENQRKICPNLIDADFHKPMALIVLSPGGYLHDSALIIKQISDALLLSKQQSGVTPTVIFSERCDSACVTLLVVMNEMAGKNQIHLIVDPSLKIGLHGAHSILSGDYSEEGTSQFKYQLLAAGINPQWLLDHEGDFASNDLKPLSLDDPELKGSNVFNNAVRKDAVEAHTAFVRGEF